MRAIFKGIFGLIIVTSGVFTAYAETKFFPACDADKGLILLSQPDPPISEISAILAQCDRKMPEDAQVLFLHGLFARYMGKANKDYRQSIIWLRKARDAASPHNPGPALELGVTYEWASQPEKAKAIYEQLLVNDPNFRPALLGLARVAFAQHHIKKAKKIYNQLLQHNPQDIDALIGLGNVKVANKEFKSAKQEFVQAQKINPNNPDTLIGLEQLSEATRYQLDLLSGGAEVGGMSSYNGSINFLANLNATDQLLLLYTHNTNELQLGSFLDTTVLPNNSATIGFQRQVPYQYGWGISYDYRERQDLITENRLNLNANVYIHPQIQWYAGAREGFPSPWNNQLYYTGFTLYTPLPWNLSITGYKGNQEKGGNSVSYSFDLSKEFANRNFYNIGSAYSPTQDNWEVHGRFIVMVFKNQGIEASYEHYFLDSSNYFNLGWRIYW